MNLLVGEEEIVDMLIKNGADTNVENSNGRTPLNGGNSYTYSYVIVVDINSFNYPSSSQLSCKWR